MKRVVDPEAEALRLAEMRRLQRQMKGVKLQYIAENDTVFFDDVAGIGEAKVKLLPCLHCQQLCCMLYAIMVSWLRCHAIKKLHSTGTSAETASVRLQDYASSQGATWLLSCLC